MARTTEEEIQRALVRKLRQGTLHSQLTGGEHEQVAPRGTREPFLTYAMLPSAVDDDWTNRLIRTLWDITVTSGDQAEANNLAALMNIELEDAPLDVSGQSVLYCRRVAGLRDKEVTDEDKTIYRFGGTYAIWTDQPLITHETSAVADTVITSG